MVQTPKYDNDIVSLGYLNKRLGDAESEINSSNKLELSKIPTNYSTPPNPPYYKDSLLCYNGKIYKCNIARKNGSFNWNDWIIVATDDTTISDFVNNTYELDKLEIQEQIDGKVQTHYQETDPSVEWKTDLEKAKHTGDYWYNTIDNTQWRYNRITTTTPITYAWGQVNVPKAVFDAIDTKKSIYTKKPTSYKKDDLWIIEETLLDEDLPIGTQENPIIRGDWVFSIDDSDTYNKEHWVKRDEDISMTYIQQHYYTIKDIDSSFEEIERNTDSKITKAKDEISLNVSQTYTTKEEHKAAIYDFDEQIGTINQTITQQKETVADISIEVGEITSTVETIEKTTKELETNIQGVSADFNNFKDNEYVNSISNLQDQIDGAIQFWNGAEVPTVNNYPTNQWTTENDKNNHRADIYTVIQDVDGEMKQGKSYRFDKVNNTWQWIELTDNELSAVQAIAQDALDKANANTTAVETLKKSVSTLEQTDTEIKASVETIDNQIQQEFNFQKSASGSNIHIEDASDNKLVDFEIEGKSEQDTRSGKNLYNYEDVNYKVNEINADSDGWITAVYDNTDGTSTKYLGYYTKPSVLLKPSTNYIVFVEIKEVSGEGYLTSVSNSSTSYASQSSTTISSNFSQLNNNSIKTGIFTTISDFSNSKSMIRSFVGINAGKSGSITFRLSVLEDTSTTVNNFVHEPYGIMPSPEYPSEIKSVGYKNLFDGEFENGIVNYITGNKSSNSTLIRSKNYIEVKPNTDYKFSAVDYDYVSVCVYEYDKDLNFIQYLVDDQPSQHTINFSKSFTTASQTKYILFRPPGVITNTDFKLIMTEGITSHSYIPYGKHGIEVKNIGDNLFSGFVKGKGLSSSNGLEITNNSGAVSDYIPINFDKNTSYTLSGLTNTLASFVAGYDEDYVFAGRTAGTERTTLTFYKTTFGAGTPSSNKPIKYIRVYQYFRTGNTGTIGDIDNLQVMLNTGSTSLNYEQYKEDKTLFVLNQPLRSLPNGIKDRLFIKNNILCVERKIGSIVLDGSDDENWNKWTTNVFFIGEITKIRNCLSNYFSFSSAQIAGALNNGQFCIASSSNNYSVLFKYTGCDNVNDFKSWLSTHNTEVQYELATPITEEIGEIEMPSTFKGINNISITDELEPVINLTHVRDTSVANYVGGQLETIVQIQERKNAELKIQDDEIKSSVSQVSQTLNNNYTSNAELEQKLDTQKQEIKTEMSTTISQTKETWQAEVLEYINKNGVEKFVNMLVTIDIDGLKLSKSDEDIVSLLNNKGLYVSDGKLREDLSNLLMKVDRAGALFKILEILGTIKEQEIIQKEVIEDTKYGTCQAWYWIGGDN